MSPTSKSSRYRPNGLSYVVMGLYGTRPPLPLPISPALALALALALVPGRLGAPQPEYRPSRTQTCERRVDVSRRPSIDSYAERQRGLITSAQLGTCGVPPSTKNDWIIAGRLAMAHEGVYRVNGAPITFEQRCLAAAFAGAPECFVDARAAVRLWGFYDFDECFIDVVVKRSRLPR